MSFLCIPPCERTFDTTRGLTLHQNICDIYLAPDVTLEQAAVKFAEKQARRKRRKLGHPEPVVPELAPLSPPLVEDAPV